MFRKRQSQSARKTRPLFETLESRQLLSSTLPLGAVTAGSVNSAGQSSQYTFTVVQGADVDIDTKATPQDSGFLAKFVLTKSGSTLLTWETNSPTDKALQDLASGTYTLTTSDYYGKYRGQFDIGLEGISPTNSNPTTLTWGGVKSGEISQSLDAQEYSFTLGAQDTVQLTSDGSPIDSGFLASFAIYSSSGARVLTWSANTPHTTGPLVLAAGKYMVKVNDYYLNNRGNFSIGLDQLNTPFSAGIQALVRGGITSGSITQPLGTKEYSFSLSAQTSVQFKTDGTPTDSGFLACFTLYSSSGANIISWSTNSTIAKAPMSLASGNYMLKVCDYYLATRGSFSIGLEFLSGSFSPDAKALPDNAITSGSVSSALDTEQYTFAATGTSATFVTTGAPVDSGFLAEFAIYTANGALVGSWESNVSKTVTASGLSINADYVLVVCDYYNANRGTFTVKASGVRPVSLASEEAGPSHSD